MLPTAWEFATLICKLVVYTGTAMLAGAWMHCLYFDDDGVRSRRGLFSFALAGALLGFHGALIYFLVQVGLISANGLAGMLDREMAGIMLDTPLGDMTMMRLSGFTIALIVSALTLWQTGSQREAASGWRLLPRPGLALALAAIGFSFSLAGHVSLQGAIQRFALLLHVLAFALWIGAISLFLWRGLARDRETLRLRLRQFGNQALGLVILLSVAGGLMLLSLLQSPGELWSSAYGRAVMIKLLLVLMILMLAAWNRYRLVPGLLLRDTSEDLRRSLRMEVVVAGLVLAVTAYFSTLIGPPGL